MAVPCPLQPDHPGGRGRRRRDAVLRALGWRPSSASQPGVSFFDWTVWSCALRARRPGARPGARPGSRPSRVPAPPLPWRRTSLAGRMSTASWHEAAARRRRAVAEPPHETHWGGYVGYWPTRTAMSGRSPTTRSGRSTPRPDHPAATASADLIAMRRADWRAGTIRSACPRPRRRRMAGCRESSYTSSSKPPSEGRSQPPPSRPLTPAAAAPVRPDFRRERRSSREGSGPVAGVDEAGRGPLAGPGGGGGRRARSRAHPRRARRFQAADAGAGARSSTR